MSKPISPDFLRHILTVSCPSVAPDGSRLAFVQSCVDEEAGETRSRIMMNDLSTGETTAFTAGHKDVAPCFSPDGRNIAFVRPDDRDHRQLWLIPVSGGEAYQITSLPGGTFDCAWAPDSESLVVVSDVDPDQLPPDHDSKKDPRVRVARRLRYRDDAVGWRGDAFRHLFVVSKKTGQVRQLTDGEGEDTAPAWSPDGSHVAFISDRAEDRDVSSGSGLFVLPATGGDPGLLSSGLFAVSAFCWSPDGLSIVAVGSDDPECNPSNQGWLFLLQRGKEPRRITDDSIAPAVGSGPAPPTPEIRWTDDERLLFLAGHRGCTHLYELSIDEDRLRRVTDESHQVVDVRFDCSASSAVALILTPGSPGDIWHLDVASGSGRQVTNLNREYLEEHAPATLQRFAIARAGFDIESRVRVPDGFEESRSYPMVLVIHGGPHGVFDDGFQPIQQVLATAGYVVLAVNPRGSSTYGASFMKEVLGDWGGGDYLDIMASVDELCRRPYIDTNRLGVLGYSYGGFMTSWIIGHDQRFKAAVVGAPVTDLSSMYGTSDIGVRFGEVQWGGVREDRLKDYEAHSPLTYAQDVTTPVLLLHGETDVRCPIGQSEQYFVALKRLGKEVELVRFPGCSHGFLRRGHPRLREEYFARALAWMDRFLRPGE
jgi:dipeptidyl aminopeptidase/acylaminoacyl peptidase